MHHLARRTSLVGRQPEALRRRGGEVEGEGGGREGEGAEQQMGIERKMKRELGTILGREKKMMK